MAKPLILNLADASESNIAFEISKFPDGQQSVTIVGGILNLVGGDVVIKSRLNNFKDLELIICANQVLKELGAAKIALYVPYFLGARSDRKFIHGSINYLKTVICPIINSQKFAEVVVVDPHSDVLEACLDNFSKMNNHAIVKAALTDIDNTNSAREKIVLVSPDAGALKKIYDVAEAFGIEDVVTAIKHRDVKTGKITHTEVPLKPLIHEHDKKFVIIDDICDGGRTFIELAKVIKERTHNSQIYLVVTHGIFSAGLLELSKYFDKIYTTDSVKEIEPESYSDYTVSSNFLKQFNLFK
jgi:ribose-phosphate pyrophosphokinase